MIKKLQICLMMSLISGCFFAAEESKEPSENVNLTLIEEILKLETDLYNYVKDREFTMKELLNELSYPQNSKPDEALKSSSFLEKGELREVNQLFSEKIKNGKKCEEAFKFKQLVETVKSCECVSTEERCKEFIYGSALYEKYNIFNKNINNLDHKGIEEKTIQSFIHYSDDLHSQLKEEYKAPIKTWFEYLFGAIVCHRWNNLGKNKELNECSNDPGLTSRVLSSDLVDSSTVLKDTEFSGQDNKQKKIAGSNLKEIENPFQNKSLFDKMNDDFVDKHQWTISRLLHGKASSWNTSKYEDKIKNNTKVSK